MKVENITKEDITEFLYKEAYILDDWNLKEWASLFTDDGTYKIPPLGRPNADPKEAIFFVHDDRERLQHRAERLLKKEAHVEYPHSTTVRNYHNIMVENLGSEIITVRCNFTTYRTKREVIDTFVGYNVYNIIPINSELWIKNKKVVLKHDSLRPHGKISLIL